MLRDPPSRRRHPLLTTALRATWHALHHNNLVVPVHLDGRNYDFGKAQEQLTNLREQLQPGGFEELAKYAESIEPRLNFVHMQAMLSESLPHLIAVHWHPEGGENQLQAAVQKMLAKLHAWQRRQDRINVLAHRSLEVVRLTVQPVVESARYSVRINKQMGGLSKSSSPSRSSWNRFSSAMPPREHDANQEERLNRWGVGSSTAGADEVMQASASSSGASARASISLSVPLGQAVSSDDPPSGILLTAAAREFGKTPAQASSSRSAPRSPARPSLPRNEAFAFEEEVVELVEDAAGRVVEAPAAHTCARPSSVAVPCSP